MLENYCDLEKKQKDSNYLNNSNNRQNNNINNYFSDSNHDSSLNNSSSTTTSCEEELIVATNSDFLSPTPDYQNFIDQQKQLIQQIHKQEKKLKQFHKTNNFSVMSSSTFQKSKLANSSTRPNSYYSPNLSSLLPNASNLLLKPIRSDSIPIHLNRKNFNQLLLLLLLLLFV